MVHDLPNMKINQILVELLLRPNFSTLQSGAWSASFDLSYQGWSQWTWIINVAPYKTELTLWNMTVNYFITCHIWWTSKRYIYVKRL
jgi:hypothetical protein